MNETRLVSLGVEWMKYSCLWWRLYTPYLHWRFVEYSWFPSEIDDWNSAAFFLFYWTNYIWSLAHIIGWSTTVLCLKLKQECSWIMLINGTERRFFYCKVYVERAVRWLPEGEIEEEWDKSRAFPSANLPPFFWAGLIKRPLNSRNMTKKFGFSLQRIIWFAVIKNWNVYAM